MTISNDQSSERANGEPTARRRWAYWLSWLFSLLLLFRGGQAVLNPPEEAPPGAAAAMIVAGLIIMPPVVARLRRAIPFLRPVWAPLVVSCGVIAITVVTGIVVTTPPKDGSGTKSNEPPMKREEGGVALYGPFVRKIVAAKLRDPESARFTNVVAYKTGEKLTFCGSVNAKNGLGGYPPDFRPGDCRRISGELYRRFRRRSAEVTSGLRCRRPMQPTVWMRDTCSAALSSAPWRTFSLAISMA